MKTAADAVSQLTRILYGCIASIRTYAHLLDTGESMVAECLRFVLSVILSPRRLLLAALLAAFLYAALVATKARYFPEPALRAGKSVPTVPARTGGRGVSSTGGTRSE